MPITGFFVFKNNATREKFKKAIRCLKAVILPNKSYEKHKKVAESKIRWSV
jgi:hypothetical protein